MIKENIPLTSIRGLLAIWVVGHHWFFSIQNPVLNNFFGYAYYSVDIFFILSGFVLTLIYKNIISTSIPKFYLKRILRVFPLHFIALIILTLVVIHPTYNFNLTINYICSVFLLNPFYISDALTNPPAWSISVEVICYLFFPFVIILIRELKRNSLLMLIGIAFILSIICQQYFRAYITGIEAIARGLTGFALGALMALLVEYIKLTPKYSNLIQLSSLALIILCIVLSGENGAVYTRGKANIKKFDITEIEKILLKDIEKNVSPYEISTLMDEHNISVSRLSNISHISERLIQDKYNEVNPGGKYFKKISFFDNFILPFLPSVLIPSIASILIFALYSNTGFFSTLLSGQLLHFYGNISYSLYLLHWIVFTFFVKGGFFNFVGEQDINMIFVLKTMVMFCVLTLLSYLTYLYIEKPFRGIYRVKLRWGEL